MEPIWVRRISGVAGVFMPKRYMNIYLMSRKKRDGFLRGRNLSYAQRQDAASITLANAERFSTMNGYRLGDGEIWKERRGGFEPMRGGAFELLPARHRGMGGRVVDLPQEAPPFEEGAFEIARAKGF